MTLRTTTMIAVVVALSCGGLWLAKRNAPTFLPAASPFGETEEGEEGEEFTRRRREWIERLHAHAPGQDWRRIDAMSREQRNAVRDTPSSGGAQRRLRGAETPLVASGTWQERGAQDQAGRVCDVDSDASTDRLTTFAHGGQLWRARRATLDWKPLNDARQFPSYYREQHFLRLNGVADRWRAAEDAHEGRYLAPVGMPERWLAADDYGVRMAYSDDQGRHWTGAGGARPDAWLETTALVARAGNRQIYALIAEWTGKTRLLASDDRGTTFADLGIVGTSYATTLFASNAGNDAVFLLVGNVLKRVESDHRLTTIATIAGAPPQSQGALTGGVAAGTPFLFAFFEADGKAQVFRSLDAGVNWTTQGTVPVAASERAAVGVAPHDPNLVYYGGVDLYRSGDGGVTFTAVNSWWEYYQDPQHKLHADISFVKVFADAAGNDVVFIGTDGGLYQSTDALASVQNLSLYGMRQAQYYASYSGRAPPHSIFVGTQDQGYQRASQPTAGIMGFTQVLSGDYASLTSSDGGQTLWMTYPTFVLLDTDPTNGGPILQWHFTQGNLQGMTFLPALQADPADAHSTWLAGGGSTDDTDHVIRLTWNGLRDGGGSITHAEGSFNFAGTITALAASSQDPALLFALVDDGSARFFRSTTPLGVWTQGARLPLAAYFYGKTIAPDPVRDKTLYIGGSGYSGSPVYVSTDNGDSFAPMGRGLPDTMVHSLAISPDGEHLFAATEVGLYYYDRKADLWVDIGAGAPDSAYWHVDYVPALHIARFSTFGRGLWDYELNAR